MEDIKMYLLNIGAFALSMSQIDMILKITLLWLSVWVNPTTAQEIHKERRKKNEEDK